MALNVTITEQKIGDGFLKTYGTLNLGVYATGGIAFTPNTFRLNKLQMVSLTGSGSYWCYVDNAASKIVAMSGGTEVTNSTDLTTYTLNFMAEGPN